MSFFLEIILQSKGVFCTTKQFGGSLTRFSSRIEDGEDFHSLDFSCCFLSIFAGLIQLIQLAGEFLRKNRLSVFSRDDRATLL